MKVVFLQKLRQKMVRKEKGEIEEETIEIEEKEEIRTEIKGIETISEIKNKRSL